VAQNSAGTSYGSDVTFTTNAAGLASLALSAGTLSPAFTSTTLSYTATVSSTTDTLTVTPTTDTVGSSISVNGSAVTSGTASNGITLTTGSNTITIVVTNNGTRTYTLNITRETAFETFLSSNGATGGNTGPTQDYDGDGISNLMEYAFGMNPAVNNSGTLAVSGAALTSHGMPLVNVDNQPTTVDYTARFVRRKDYATAGLVYTVQFSADLTTWQSSVATPTVVASDATHDAVSVPYPFFVNGKKARFFRITVSTTP
jgi:hypothetical protein